MLVGREDPDVEELLPLAEAGGDVAVDEAAHGRGHLEGADAELRGPLAVDLDLDLGLGRLVIGVQVDELGDVRRARSGSCPAAVVRLSRFVLLTLIWIGSWAKLWAALPPMDIDSWNVSLAPGISGQLGPQAVLVLLGHPAVFILTLTVASSDAPSVVPMTEKTSLTSGSLRRMSSIRRTVRSVLSRELPEATWTLMLNSGRSPCGVPPMPTRVKSQPLRAKIARVTAMTLFRWPTAHLRIGR